MADVIAEAGADLVAIQEVITSAPGAAAVARLEAALDARGQAWESAVSGETTGRASERFAYLWRADRVAPQGSFWLEPTLASTFDREPFMGRFVLRGGGRDEPLLVASFHAPPTSRDPERELTLLPALHRTYPDDDLVLAGDFNLDAQRPPFDGLRAEGFAQALPPGERTTLKAVESPSGERLASAYDNVFYEPAELRVAAARVLDFSGRLPTLRDARNVSDHLPVLVEFAW
jgi:endonuclease/exonuclease/phosphatase family metal-dependent hydrolase